MSYKNLLYFLLLLICILVYFMYKLSKNDRSELDILTNELRSNQIYGEFDDEKIPIRLTSEITKLFTNREFTENELLSIKDIILHIKYYFYPLNPIKNHNKKLLQLILGDTLYDLEEFKIIHYILYRLINTNLKEYKEHEEILTLIFNYNNQDKQTRKDRLVSINNIILNLNSLLDTPSNSYLYSISLKKILNREKYELNELKLILSIIENLNKRINNQDEFNYLNTKKIKYKEKYASLLEIILNKDKSKLKCISQILEKLTINNEDEYMEKVTEEIKNI